MPIDAVVREIFALCKASTSSGSVNVSEMLSTKYNCAIYSFRLYPRSASRKKAKTENLIIN